MQFLTSGRCLLIVLFFFIAGCAGTGTRDFAEIQAKQSDKKHALFIIRPFDPISAVSVVNIAVDKAPVARVGTSEIVRVDVTGGEHAITTSVGLHLNMLGIGTKKHTQMIQAKDKTHYYRLTWSPGLFAGTFKLVSINESDWMVLKNKL